MSYLEMEVCQKDCEVLLRVIVPAVAALEEKSEATGLTEDDRAALRFLTDLKDELLDLIV